MKPYQETFGAVIRTLFFFLVFSLLLDRIAPISNDILRRVCLIAPLSLIVWFFWPFVQVFWKPDGEVK